MRPIDGMISLVASMRLTTTACCVLVDEITDLDLSAPKTMTVCTLADHLAGAVCID